MPVDEQVRLFLQNLAAQNLPELSTLSITEARARTNSPNNTEPLTTLSIQDKSFSYDAITLKIRIYTPLSTGPFPGLLYFHGGGFALGSIDGSDHTCQTLAHNTQSVVISVEYRLAPEHPFPAATEDAYAATCWVVKHAKELHIIPDQIGVAGTSAGATLATVVCLMARDRQGPQLHFQLLLYPVTSMDFDTPSHKELGQGYLITHNDMRWFCDMYLLDPSHKHNPYAVPLYSPNLSHLPRALLVTAEYDPLRDEGAAYAERLTQAGVKVDYRCYSGLIHGFIGMHKQFTHANIAWQEICQLTQQYMQM